MFYMRHLLLFSFIFIFCSHAFGMEKPTDLDKMRRQSINDVICCLHNLKNKDDYCNKRTYDPILSKQIKDDPTDYDKYLNAEYASLIDNYCQVAAEKLQVRPNSLEYFNYMHQKGYFQDSEINKKIADHITITKNDLCQHWPTTEEVIEPYRKLFEFPSKLSILEFPTISNPMKKMVILLRPIYYNRVESTDPILTIKNALKRDYSAQDVFFKCSISVTLEDIFEQGDWLAGLNFGDEQKKLMDEFNSQLPLEKKIVLINAKQLAGDWRQKFANVNGQVTRIKQETATLTGENADLEAQLSDRRREVVELEWKKKKRMCIFFAIGIVGGFIFAYLNPSKLDNLCNKLKARGLFLFPCIKKLFNY